MTITQQEIDALLVQAAHPNVTEFDSLKEMFALTVASRIVKYKDASLLDKMPPWTRPLVESMADEYRKFGRFGYVSNLGHADHTELARELSNLIAPRSSGK